MAITSIEELWRGRGADFDDEGNRTYDRVFLVRTDDKTDSPWDVAAAFNNVALISPVIVIGSAYPDDANAYANRMVPDNHSETPFAYEVTIGYSTRTALADNPLNDPPKIEWGTEQFQKPAVEDLNGDAIVNSAGDPFDPPASMDDSRRTCRISANVAAVPAWFLSYADSTNIAAVTIDGFAFSIGQVKVQRTSVGQQETRNGVSFRKIGIDLHLREDGFKLRILDRGFRQIVAGSANDREQVADDEGISPDQPILLDGAGSKLANPNAANAVFLEFEVYPAKDLTLLPGIT